MLSERWHDFWLRLRTLFRRRRLDRDLEEELQFHLALRGQKLMQQGLSPEEARAAARRVFGNVTRVKETSRELWAFRWIEALLQDVRYGLRQLRRNPGFTAVAVITLALGIGANTAIFSVVNAVLLRPLPYPRPDRLVFLEGAPVFDFVSNPEPQGVVAGWLNHTRSFERTAIYETGEVNLAGGERPERVKAAEVTTGFFQVLGIEPYGRAFLSGEAAPGRDHVAVLSQELCRRFGAPADVAGRSILVNGVPFTVLGVMPAGFSFPGKTQIWMPVPVPWTFSNDQIAAGTIFFTPIARLRRGVTPAQAWDEVVRLASAPPGNFEQARESIEIKPLKEALLGNDRPVLWLLFGAVTFVLLIACANVSNLLLARAVLREREVGLRAALGASRARLVRQNLTEGILLSCFGGAGGLLLAVWSFHALRLLMPPKLDFAEPMRLDMRVLAFTVAVSLVSALLFGLFPSLHVFPTDLIRAIKEGGAAESSSRNSMGRTRPLLLVSEVALSLVLLAGAGLLLKSFWRLAAVNPGFNPERLMTTKISLAESLYQAPARRLEFYASVLRRTAALPGVRGAAFTTTLPFGESAYSAFRLQVKERPPGGRPSGISSLGIYSAVSPDYFQVMGIPLLAGRFFSDADHEGAPKVAIVSDSLARALWRGKSPLGQHVSFPSEKPHWLEIVGVVGDTRQASLAAQPSGYLYLPLQQSPSPTVSLVIRTAGDPALIAGEVRRAVAQVDRNEPLSSFLSMRERISTSMAGPRFRTVLLVLFAFLALTLAVVGIFGVMSYTVSQRTHEIGIRMALGAQKADVLRMVVGQGLKLALIGVGIGTAGAFALTRFLASLLYGVKPTDPLTFLAVSLILTGVTLLASYIPARRAARVDPMAALRCE